MLKTILLGLGAVVVAIWAFHLVLGAITGLIALLVSVLAPALLVLGVVYGAYRLLI